MTRSWGLFLILALIPAAGYCTGDEPGNMFVNPSFEKGRSLWRISTAKGTEASFSVKEGDAKDGEYSAVVKLEAVKEWGAQFGQSMDAAKKGTKLTYAVFARSLSGPTEIYLRVERRAKPWDAAGQKYGLKIDETWKELYITFTVEKDFTEGWFPFVGCKKANSEFRVDIFRLYEGDYVPYEKSPQKKAALSRRPVVYDTGESSSSALPGADVAAAKGWARLDVGTTKHDFKGDAVLSNNRLALVVRKGGPGAELYGRGGGGAVQRAMLGPAAGGAVVKVGSVGIRKYDDGSAELEVGFTAENEAACSIAFELKADRLFVAATPGKGAKALRVEAPCRHVVLPDFFSDDIVVQAGEILVERAELPSEHLLMHLVGRGDAIVVNAWSVAGKDVGIALAGKGEERTIRASEIRFGKDGKAWVAVLEAPGIWGEKELKPEERGKVVPMEWKRPFPAQWRVDFRRRNKLTGSWGMVSQNKDGKFTKHGWLGTSDGTLPADRKRWTTVVGNFQYPCWTDGEGRGFLQSLDKKNIGFEGSAVVYPIDRLRDTPLEAYTVVDIMRDTLGVGPCEYILDVESQKVKWGGVATCGARDRLNKIYGQGNQKKERDRIEETLKEVLQFVRFIRGKIEAYVVFGQNMRAYLSAQKKAHPEAAGFIDEMAGLAGTIDERYAARRAHIKTVEETAAMIDRFRAEMLDYEGPDAAKKVKEFAKALVRIGSNQDELVGQCRWAVKALRQRAGMAVAVNPEAAEIAREIRERTRKALLNPAGHEAPRH